MQLLESESSMESYTSSQHALSSNYPPLPRHNAKYDILKLFYWFPEWIKQWNHLSELWWVWEIDDEDVGGVW